MSFSVGKRLCEIGFCMGDGELDRYINFRMLVERFLIFIYFLDIYILKIREMLNSKL